MMSTLVPLRPDAARGYHPLLRRNAAHLGPNYATELALSIADHAALFAENPDPPLMFGIHVGDALVGRVDLVAVNPPRYGIGYWLTEEVTGRGYATTAVRAATEYAATRLGATDVFAGVSHGNAKSVAVLERIGFEKVADFETYARFHLGLTPAGGT